MLRGGTHCRTHLGLRMVLVLGRGFISCALFQQELTEKEFEYVSLSRDTTETDLKQRREIQGGTAYHIDQVSGPPTTSTR